VLLLCCCIIAFLIVWQLRRESRDDRRWSYPRSGGWVSFSFVAAFCSFFIFLGAWVVLEWCLSGWYQGLATLSTSFDSIFTPFGLRQFQISEGLDWLEITATEWYVQRCHGFGCRRYVETKQNNEQINNWSCFWATVLFLVITSLIHSTYAWRVFVAWRRIWAQSNLFFLEEQIHRRSCLPFAWLISSPGSWFHSHHFNCSMK